LTQTNETQKTMQKLHPIQKAISEGHAVVIIPTPDSYEVAYVSPSRAARAIEPSTRAQNEDPPLVTSSPPSLDEALDTLCELYTLHTHDWTTRHQVDLVLNKPNKDTEV